MLKKIMLILLSLLIVLGVCYINATQFNTKQLKVREEKLTVDSLDNDILIAYFTDLHYGNFIDNDYLDKVIEKLNDFNPDIIIFGGDLLDKITDIKISSENRQYLIDSLKSLETTYGKYAVLGNHDLTNSSTKDDVIDILTKAEFKILTNENTTIYTSVNSAINIVGIDSLSGGSPDPETAFNGINTNNYTFVITHCPDTFVDIQNYNFDYMLAGHSHGGQIYIPLVSYFTRVKGCEKYFRGKYKTDNKILDISNGVGRTRYNARFMADSEIVLYRLSPTKIDTEE